MQLDLFEYPTDRSRMSAFSSPPDMMGRYAVGLDYTGQPVNENAADVDLTVPAVPGLPAAARRFALRARPLGRPPPRRPHGCTIDPHQSAIGPTQYVNTAGAVTSSVSDVVADTDDAPFATAELERILRAYDADAGILPDRLWNIVSVFDPLKLIDFNRLQVAATARNDVRPRTHRHRSTTPKCSPPPRRWPASAAAR